MKTKIEANRDGVWERGEREKFVRRTRIVAYTRIVAHLKCNEREVYEVPASQENAFAMRQCWAVEPILRQRFRA